MTNFNARLAKHLDERRRAGDRAATHVAYRKRRPNETAEDYAAAMARGYMTLLTLSAQSRNPQDYD